MPLEMKKINGTPWHIGYITKTDERRDKRRCIYYVKKDNSCFRIAGKCIGSSHCKQYAEKNQDKAKSKAITKIEDFFSLSVTDVLDVNTFEMIQILFPSEYRAIVDACCILADNIEKWHFKDQDKTISIRSRNSENYLSLKRRMNWEVQANKVGKTALAKQFTSIVQFFLRDKAPVMIGADITYLDLSLHQYIDVPHAIGTPKRLDEISIVNYVFRAIYVRYNHIGYGFQIKQ